MTVEWLSHCTKQQLTGNRGHSEDNTRHTKTE